MAVHARRLSEQLLRHSDRDFRPTLARARWAREERSGVHVALVETNALGEELLSALLGWRLAQYLFTGFYDEARVRELGWTTEPRESVHDDDLHGLALDGRGRLLCYVTLKQPEGLATARYAAVGRSPFPCEEVHGRAWQELLTLPDDLPAATVWELARFCRDQRRGRLDAASRRAPLELALGVAHFARRPSEQLRIRAATGDFDPDVALRNVRFFFIPVATFAPHQVKLPAGHPLTPRYAQHPTAPFLATTDDIDNATYLRWVDIDMALDRDNAEAARRLRALRNVVSVRESSFKRPPLHSVDRGPFPEAALARASSREAGLALWHAAEAGELPGWTASLLGPGEHVRVDRVLWVVNGYVQAKTRVGRRLEHLAGIGADVAYVGGANGDAVASLTAATPVRALVTERGAFEDFWRRRQKAFETSTATLYGEAVGWRSQ